jgi:hypothetical protein
MRVHRAALLLDRVGLALPVLLAARLKRKQLRLPIEPLQSFRKCHIDCACCHPI